MPFDIHGQHLRDGYCEVHPDNPMPYPCFQCQQDQENSWRLNVERHRYEQEEQARYERDVGGLVWLELLGKVAASDGEPQS